MLVQAAGKKWIVRLMLGCEIIRHLANHLLIHLVRGRVHESHTRDLVTSTELQWVVILDEPVIWINDQGRSKCRVNGRTRPDDSDRRGRRFGARISSGKCVVAMSACSLGMALAINGFAYMILPVYISYEAHCLLTTM